MGNKPYRLAVCTTYADEELVIKRLINLDRECRKNNIRMVAYSTSAGLFSETDSINEDFKVFADINYTDFDAILCFSELIKHKESLDIIAAKSNEAGIPVFMLERHVEGGIDLVFDYRSAFEEMCRHIVEHHGCRKINYLSGMPDNDFSLERENIYRKVLMDNGIPVEEDRIYYGYFWEDPAEKAMDEMLSKDEIPEAIICANDLMAIVACKKLKEKGLRVPEDVIVSGIDGIERGKWNEPQLTTCVLDEAYIAQSFVQIITDYIEGRDRKDKYELHYRFEPGESCGCKDRNYYITADNIFEIYNRNKGYMYYQMNMYNMQAMITNARDMSEIREALFIHLVCNGMIALDMDIEEFVDNTPHNIGDYPDREDLMHVFFQGWAGSQTDNRVCKRSELLKDFDSHLNTYYSVIVFPVHFSGEFYGYMFFEMLPEPVFFNKIVIFNYSLGNALGVYKAKKSLLAANDQLETANGKLAELYVKDYLTKLYNRRGFYNEIRHMILECSENNKELFVISVDMDDLKGINDTFGHSEGDVALKTFGSAMTAVTRESEICARFGGDEFMVAGTAENGKERAEEIIRNIKAYLDEFNSRSGKPYLVNGSTGLSVTKPDNDFAIDELMLAADTLMYEDKKDRKRKFRTAVRNPEKPE